MKANVFRPGWSNWRVANRLAVNARAVPGGLGTNRIRLRSRECIGSYRRRHPPDISSRIQEAIVNGNGTNKKKRRRLFIYGGIALGIVLLIAVGVFAATRGGTKIDPSKLAKVERETWPRA